MVNIASRLSIRKFDEQNTCDKQDRVLIENLNFILNILKLNTSLIGSFSNKTKTTSFSSLSVDNWKGFEYTRLSITIVIQVDFGQFFTSFYLFAICYSLDISSGNWSNLIHSRNGANKIPTLYHASSFCPSKKEKKWQIATITYSIFWLHTTAADVSLGVLQLIDQHRFVKQSYLSCQNSACLISQTTRNCNTVYSKWFVFTNKVVFIE